jgi:hypothetical protein
MIHTHSLMLDPKWIKSIFCAFLAEVLFSLIFLLFFLSIWHQKKLLLTFIILRSFKGMHILVYKNWLKVYFHNLVN